MPGLAALRRHDEELRVFSLEGYKGQLRAIRATAYTTAGGLAERDLALLRAVEGVKEVTVVVDTGAQWEFQVTTISDLRPTLAKALIAADIELLRMDRVLGLETLFLHLTEKEG